MQRSRSHRSALVPALIALLLLPLAAGATVPAPLAPPDDSLSPGQLEFWLEGGPSGSRVVPDPLGPFNYVREFDQMVSFFAAWQVTDPDSSDYGGMIEAESGALAGVIQTDNTLEAIWCWSRYREFSGRDTYDDNIAAAWVYCTNYPAWAEAGAVGENYYRVHNCAWGLTAVLQYKAATGDDSFDAYAQTCASYIDTRPLNLYSGDAYTRRLNAFCKGWAVGNLYLYAEAIGDATLMDAAITQGEDVLSWINTFPPAYLAYEYWAMSSGTAMWGVCNSVFRDDPAQGQAWLAANGGYMDVWSDWYDVPGYDWDSAWNVAYCNAHFAVWDVTGDPDYWLNGKYVADNLLSLDTDDDGGITAETIDPATEDMSWVTCYLVKFGVDRLMGEPPDHDVGVLRFAGLEDGQVFEVGVPVPVAVVATNYGLADEADAEVHLVSDAGDTIWTDVDLPFAALETYTYGTAWIPPTDGFYTLTAWTELAGDEDPANDTVTVTIQVGDPSSVPEDVALVSFGGPARNPFARGTSFNLSLGVDADVLLAVYDVRGRLVARIADGRFGRGDHRLEWDGRDRSGRSLPSGVYLYRFEAAGRSSNGKLVKLR